MVAVKIPRRSKFRPARPKVRVCVLLTSTTQKDFQFEENAKKTVKSRERSLLLSLLNTDRRLSSNSNPSLIGSNSTGCSRT